MSLYNKHRPTTFDEMAGNQKTLSACINLISKENPPNSYLLIGGTGCGKTTLARIIAKELGCVGSDFKELDSAQYRGIDDVRDIRNKSQYKPMEGECSVWLLDECHKLTNDAQNALLKILEDPPANVYFILSTTDPQKLLKTIKGRCSTFELSPLADDEMYKLLRKIVKAEGERMDKDVYEQIIQDSMGHPRNAINILEQVLAVDSDDRLEMAKRKAEEAGEAIELCRALVAGKSWKSVSVILKGLKQQEPESIRRNVLGYASAVLLNSPENDRCGLILEEFKNPLYDIGFPGLVLACYSICRN